MDCRLNAITNAEAGTFQPADFCNDDACPCSGRFRLLLRYTRDLVVRWDRSGAILFANPPMARALGRPLEDIIGKTVEELGLLGRVTERWRFEISQVFEQGSPRSFYHIGGSEGRERHYEVTAVPEFGLGGERDPAEPVSVLTISHDVTAERDAEAALREARDQYATLFRTMSQGVVYQDANGVITAANRAAEEILGLSFEEMAGRVSPDPRWRAIREDGSDFPGDEHPAMVALRECREVHGVVMGVFNPKREDWVWIEIDAVPDFDAEGHPFRVYTIFADVTERRRAEQEIERHSARMESLARVAARLNQHLTRDALLAAVCAETAEAVGAPAAAVALLDEVSDRFRYEAITGLPEGFVKSLVPLTRERFEAHGLIRGPVVLGPSALERSPNREVHARHGVRTVLMVPLRWGRRLMGLLFVYALEEPREFAQEELVLLQGIADQACHAVVHVNLEEQQRQATKMEALGRLASGIAHDFNNLLTALGGYGDLLLSRAGEDDSLAAEIEEIRSAISRATGLTRQLLAFSRRQPVKAATTDLNGVVGGLEKMLERMIGEDIELIIEAAEERATVWADPGQLDQIILNLAVNARDAMPDGGRLTISTHVMHDHVLGLAGTGEEGEWVELAVSDTGHGMNEEVLKRVFEPFFTTKPEGKGTGLGLASVYGIVRQNGGYVRGASQEGVGTTFYVYLPHHVGSEPSAESVEQLPLVHTGDILLVEDESTVRRLVERILSGAGYRVDSAEDPETAVRRIEGGESYDLLITDVIMPGIKGTDLAALAREKSPGLPVVFMSGYSAGELDGLADMEDAYFIAKPFAAGQLLSQVGQALCRRVAAEV
ncbi:MAG: response regulator [Thermoleophilia bacterium]